MRRLEKNCNAYAQCTSWKSWCFKLLFCYPNQGIKGWSGEGSLIIWYIYMKFLQCLPHYHSAEGSTSVLDNESEISICNIVIFFLYMFCLTWWHLLSPMYQMSEKLPWQYPHWHMTDPPHDIHGYHSHTKGPDQNFLKTFKRLNHIQ